MEISRREFIALFGGLSGAALVAGGLTEVLSLPEKLIKRAQTGPGIETWKNTICELCPGGCGVRFRLIDGVPVGIKGNPLYPVNQGGMCPLGHSALQRLYSPDRIKGPLKRVEEHGRVKWESISWDDALEIVAAKMKSLRQENRAHQTAFLSGTESSVMNDHIDRFMKAYGSPNNLNYNPFSPDNSYLTLMQGIDRAPAPDFLNAKYILSLGFNFMEEETAPVYFTKLYSRLRGEGDSPRTRFIQVDPRMNLTAANADRWIPLRPGTYGAFALGLAYVLIREELFDQSFMSKYVFGFDNWQDDSGREHDGLRQLILEKYYPDQVAEITGIPGKTILELGRQLGNNRPALVLSGGAAAQNVNGVFNLMAAHLLNLLLGNLQQPGGMYFPADPPLSTLAEFEPDAAAEKSLKQPKLGNKEDSALPLKGFSQNQFIGQVISGKPYPLELLFVYHGNPLFHSLDSQGFAESLKKIPMVVSFSSFLDETSEFADLILPDHEFMEKWDVVSHIPGVSFNHVGMVQPITEPFYDTRQTGDVLLQLARELGEEIADKMPWESYRDLLHHRLQGVYESGRGAVISERIRESWLEYLMQRGWQVGRYASFDEFIEQMVENGGWWDPIHSENSMDDLIQTSTGRIEVYSNLLKKMMPEEKDDSFYMPHHEPLPDSAGMPLYLNIFQNTILRNDMGSLQPLALEMFGYLTRKYWQTWAELHPETADTYGLKEGDLIWIESIKGSIKATLHIHPGIMPRVVGVPFGLGHSSSGRFASGVGENPFTILQPLEDPISGAGAIQATRVKILKIS